MRPVAPPRPLPDNILQHLIPYTQVLNKGPTMPTRLPTYSTAVPASDRIRETVTRPRAAVAAHGCKLNQAEADVISRQLADAGFHIVPSSSEADLYVLNTCSVTHVADAKARQWLNGAKRRNPKARVIATGCYSTRAPEEVEALQSVDALVLNPDKGRLAEVASEMVMGWEKGKIISYANGASGGERSRAFVKVQDGCNQFCAFCVIPKTRGREANVATEQVLADIRARLDEGFKEVVITGPQIGSFGQYPPTPEFRRDPLNYDGRLHGLIERILAETDLPRLRVSSIQPQDLTPRLLNTFRDPRVCDHVHLALQSGSDETLENMGRRYGTQEYREAVRRLRESIPGIAITTDVMVGFPGETPDRFDESYRFCEEIAFAAMHVFPYSPRPGTRAYDLNGLPDEEEKRNRMSKMLALAEKSAKAYRRSFIGEIQYVLWEERVLLDGVEYWSGLSGNYVRAYARNDRINENEITRVLATGEVGKGLIVEQAGLPAAEGA